MLDYKVLVFHESKKLLSKNYPRDLIQFVDILI